MELRDKLIEYFEEQTSNTRGGDLVINLSTIEECKEMADEVIDLVKKLNIDDVMPRSFGMVRWYNNTEDDVACVSIDKAKEYVEKYNKLSGKQDCYVDEDIYLLLNDA